MRLNLIAGGAGGVLRVRPANRPNWTDMPAVLEQYSCFVPIDASADKMICGYQALWRATKDSVLLAKARALGDTITRVQQSDGRIPTPTIPEGGASVVSHMAKCYNVAS